jgi:hypothetical protein
MTKVSKQLVNGCNTIRIYHSTLLLAPAAFVPPVNGDIRELSHWLFLYNQSKITQTVTQTISGAETGLKSPFAEPVNEQHPLVAAIAGLLGVEAAVPVGYQLIVIKGRHFDWEPLERHILILFSTFLLELPT